MRRVLLALATLVAPAALLSTQASAQAPGAACGMVTRHRHGATQYRSQAFEDASVYLYGDSITYQVWKRVYAESAGVGIDAYWGRPTAPTVQKLLDDVSWHMPDVVVMAIGTNDWMHPDLMAQQVRTVRARLPLSTRLLWVNTYTDVHPGWQAINKAIASVPGVMVVDWADRNYAYRLTSTGTGSPLLYDGVHLNCQGGQVWIDMVEQAIALATATPA